MSKSRPSNLPKLPADAKVLIATHPGTTAALLENGKPTVMKFKDGHAVLDWAVANRVPLFYMPDAGSGN
jgi:hypothetical protein